MTVPTWTYKGKVITELTDMPESTFQPIDSILVKNN